MTITVAVGSAQSPDGREAAVQATRKALDQLGNTSATFGMIFASAEFTIDTILAGVSSLTSSLPIWGFSTTQPFDSQGAIPRSVVVTLVAGSDLKGQASWWQDFSPNNLGDTQRLLPLLQTGMLLQRCLFVAGEGFNLDAIQFYSLLTRLRLPICGCLASASPLAGETFQIAGNQAGPHGLATLLVSGDFHMGVGTAHGWLPTGHHFKVTEMDKTVLRSLDGQFPAQVYSRLLGHTPEEWSLPPLADMIRLYPLGMVLEQNKNLLIRSPLRVNPDGSFLMNAPLQEGSTVYMMVGTRPACLRAVGNAVKTALEGLETKPVLALVFIDAAWQLLLETQGSPELDALRSALGSDVAIAGGYTFGQVIGNPPTSLPELLNQHILVYILAE
jgi:hypothetical protein